jgi:hypothetical protein
MEVPRRRRVRSALAAALTLLTLAPAGLLFAGVWDDLSQRRDNTRLEQRGLEYLSALTPLISALTESQTSALAGDRKQSPALTEAVRQVAATDQRIGASLGTQVRWNGLQQKIQLLSRTSGGDVTVFRAHVEVSDLTLALYEAVRDNAVLARDPDNDLSHLQQAVAVDLPVTVVSVSRMGDLSKLVAEADAGARAQLTPQFGAAVLAVNSNVDSLTDNLQAAVDDTASPTLSGNLVTGLDSFRRGVEALTRGANPGGTPNTATMATAQSQLQIALSNLSGITIREMSSLLETRMDELGTRTAEMLTAAGGLLLLVLAAAAMPLTGHRPRRRASPPPPPGFTGDVTVSGSQQREPAGVLH